MITPHIFSENFYSTDDLINKLINSLIENNCEQFDFCSALYIETVKPFIFVSNIDNLYNNLANHIADLDSAEGINYLTNKKIEFDQTAKTLDSIYSLENGIDNNAILAGKGLTLFLDQLSNKKHEFPAMILKTQTYEKFNDMILNDLYDLKYFQQRIAPAIFIELA